MTTRKEAKKFLFEQLEKLHKEEHVDDLMKAGRLDELAEIAKDLDFSVFNDFFDGHEEFFLKLEEIPEGYHYETIFYFTCQEEDWEDEVIFDNYYEVIEFFRDCKEKCAENIADLMENYNLCGLTLKELLTGEVEEL